MTAATESPINDTDVFINLGPDITTYRVACLLCSAFEGGSNYWIREASYAFADGIKMSDVREGGRFADPNDYWHPLQIVPFIEGCKVLIVDDEDGKTLELTREKLLEGLKAMAKSKYSHHWANFINEDDDAETGDVFLQFCLFGDIIYS